MPCGIISWEGDVADRLIRRVGRLRESLTPVAILLLLASADAVIAQAPVVRDSAGVRIVENDPSVLDGRTPWLIGAEPLVSIRVQDGRRRTSSPTCRALPFSRTARSP